MRRVGAGFSLLLAGCLAKVQDPKTTQEPPREVVCEDPSPASAPTNARLLTRFEYENTVHSLLGAVVLDVAFPPENRTLGLDNDATNHSASPLLIEKHFEAAESLARQAVGQGSTIFGFEPTLADASQVRTFLNVFLPRAFRRSVSSEEVEGFVDLFEDERMNRGPEDGLSLVVEAILVSPSFLYRIEASPPADASDFEPVTPFELATRISYFVTGSSPDATLLAKAIDASIAETGVIASETRRLFRSSARPTVEHFHELWLGTDELSHMVKDANAFPEWSPAVREGLRASLRDFATHAYFDLGDMDGLMTDPSLFLDANTAAIFGFPRPPPGATKHFFAAASQRAGLLTQPALMARYSLPAQTSPIQRGVFVLDAILCDPPDPPPPVPVVPPDPDPSATTRERFRQHTENPVCAECHRRIDPMGFGFESFDAIGRFRQKEGGMPVDASGAIVGVREKSIEGSFRGPIELSARLAKSRQVQDCLATRWFRYAIGRVETSNDACSLENVKSEFIRSNGKFEDLFVAITTSDAFRLKAKELE